MTYRGGDVCVPPHRPGTAGFGLTNFEFTIDARTGNVLIEGSSGRPGELSRVAGTYALQRCSATNQAYSIGRSPSTCDSISSSMTSSVASLSASAITCVGTVLMNIGTSSQL